MLEPKLFTRGNSLVLTSPTPPPMVEENEYKTFTVGVTHFVSPSSPFRDSLNPGICSRRKVRTASGESHDWRVGRSRWEARSFFVFRLYVSNAALKTETKLDSEVDVEGTADMMVRGEGGNRRVGAQQAHVPPETDRKSTRLNSSHPVSSRMPSSA